MGRYNFSDIFQVDFGGTVSPKRKIRVNGTIVDTGVIIRKGVLVGGVDLFELKDNEIEAEEQGDTLILRSIYQ